MLFRSGTLEKWGMGYAVLSVKFPRLIHARVTGFGADGPLGGMPGYDAIVQTMTGLSSCNGSPESGPVKLGVPMVDMTTGLNLVIGILMALHERHRSGRGQFVEVALYDAGLSILHPHSGNWLMAGRIPKLLGNAHPNLTPYDLFETATRPIYLGIGNDTQFKKAMVVLGLTAAANDVRFKTMAARNAHRAELTQMLKNAFIQVDGIKVSLELLRAGIPAGPLNNIEEALNDPQTKVREMVIEKDGYRGIASPVRLSRSKSETLLAPPDFGADNRYVLAQAGYTNDEIEQLTALGVVVAKKAG